MTVKQLTGNQEAKLIKFMEAQGCRVKPTKNGLIIFSPSGQSVSVHKTPGEARGTQNDIANFRRIGLRHPEDKKELTVNVNEEGYPDYITGAIAGTTRKKVLYELESKGWPLEVRATELSLETVTAHRALYAVGYRLDDPQSNKRSRLWRAPDDIRELHEKAKAEMQRREAEAKAERDRLRAERQERPPVPTPADVVKGLAQTVENIQTTFSVVEQMEQPEDKGESELHPEVAPTPEREFIDSVDSWTVDDGAPDVYIPMPVRKYLSALRGAGLEVEIRVWKA